MLLILYNYLTLGVGPGKMNASCICTSKIAYIRATKAEQGMLPRHRYRIRDEKDKRPKNQMRHQKPRKQ